jgi:anthranilate phosphoribosyltransferase
VDQETVLLMQAILTDDAKQKRLAEILAAHASKGG